MRTVMWVVGYLIVINLCGFASMGIDKKRAINHAWRISETMLFFIAIAGGSIGSILGMKAFRHKTKHLKFVIGMPLVLIIQIVLIVLAHFMPNISISMM